MIEAHPAVLAAAAYGVPSEHTEEDVAVSVALRPGRELSEEELLEYCRGHMARYMLPVFVRFLDMLPKTPTEKPEKTTLRERHLRTLGKVAFATGASRNTDASRNKEWEKPCPEPAGRP